MDNERNYYRVQQEKMAIEQAKMKVDQQMMALQTRYEDEVKLRVDFEVKINKLHNLTITQRNHDTTLNKRIEQLNSSLTEYRNRCEVQEAEIIQLRSYKAKADLIKNENEVVIEAAKRDVMSNKMKIQKVTSEMEITDTKLSQKSKLNLQLHGEIAQRNSKIKTLTDLVEEAKIKESEKMGQQSLYSQ